MITSVPPSAQVYYRDKYWNDHQLIRDFFLRRMSGGLPAALRCWHQYFLEDYLDNKPAKRALFLNCGNGWVERELYDAGLFESGVGFDYSPELVAQAETEAGKRNIVYFVADCNAVEFEAETFDLVVNYAALHHVQWIDRMQRLVARTLTADGHFVNFDYIGPHRNQYGRKLFGRMEQVNTLLGPQFCAVPFNHPSLDAMLAADPTEAIHSELILETFARYFYTLERRDLNGGIAYQIMHNNHELFLEGIKSARQCVEFLLEVDELGSEFAEIPPLFSFFIGRPKKALFTAFGEARLAEWTREEAEREAAAAKNGGRY